MKGFLEIGQVVLGKRGSMGKQCIGDGLETPECLPYFQRIEKCYKGKTYIHRG